LVALSIEFGQCQDIASRFLGAVQATLGLATGTSLSPGRFCCLSPLSAN
jgi:hypothetical protein